MKNGLKRVLATALTLLIMMQCAPLNAFAAGLGNEVATFASTDIQLQHGSAVIPYGADLAKVKQILGNTLISNKDEVNTSSVEWEYYCTGKSGRLTNDAWGSISGFTSTSKILGKTYTYEHPALANNNDSTYRVRITGTTTEVTLTKASKLSGSIAVNEGCSVTIPHNEDGSVNYAELYQKLFDAVVASTTPALTREQLTIAYEATATTGVVKNYMPLEGGTKNLLTYPAISAGNQKIKFSWNGNADYYGFEKEVAVTLTERRTTNLVLKADQNVTLTYKDGTVDYSTLKNAIFDAVFDESSTPNNLKAADVTIEYYYEGLTTAGSKWVPLAGGKVDYVNYDGLTIGDNQKIRVSWNGNADYSAAAAETTVNIVEGRSACTIVISGGKLNIRNLSVDDIRGKIVTKSDVTLTSDNSSIEYYYEGSLGSIGAGWKTLESVSEGTFKIRVVFAGNEEYSSAVSNEAEIRFVTKEDAEIRLKAAPYSVALLYNEAVEIDFGALKDAIFQTVVDSTTPALTRGDLTIEYYYKGITSADSKWVPLEGKEIGLGQGYPPISAGDQKIRFSWGGNDNYYGFEREVTVTLTDRSAANLVLKAGQNVALTCKADGTVDYSALKNAIFVAVFDAESSTPALNAEAVSIEYYYKGYKWVPLAGGKVDYVDYDGMTVGNNQKIRVSWNGNASYSAAAAETTVNIVEGRSACTIVISGGKLNIRNLSVDDILDSIVEQSDVELTSDNATVEYYYGGIGGIGAGWKTLESVSEGTFKIRVVFAGNEEYSSAVSNAAEIRFVTKEDAEIVLKDAPYSVALPYNEAVEIDFGALKDAIFQTVVASTVPEVTAADVSFLYYATAESGSVGDLGKEWVKLEGDKVNGLTYPAISAGEQKIKFSWAGNDAYYGFEQEVTVTLTERETAPYNLKNPIDSVTLVVDDDLNVDYAAVEKAVFHAVIASSEVLTAENVTIEYYYKGITSVDSKWLPLEGQEIVLGQGYPAISAGEQRIRICWAGNIKYAPTVVEVTVNVMDRPAVEFTLNEAPYEIGLVFSGVDSCDYDATAEAIYNTVVASTVNPEGLTAADVKVEYNTDKTGITNSYKDLSKTDVSGLVKFGAGIWKIRISWAGTKEFKGGSVIVDVTMSDNRLESAVLLAEGVSFTYNMDADVMKQAIFDSVIDWENSTLPAKETLTLDDFVILYQASLRDIETGTSLPELPSIPGLPDLSENDMLTQWVPIEGKVYEVAGKVLGQYPQMGAGQQKIRVTFVGNSEYRPSETAEGTVTVNKASVSVKVKTMSMYVDETLPSDFITTNPADKFDIYTISAGITSNVTTAVYLNLPSRYQNPVFLKILDPIVENLYGKSFTQMMNDGITLGELRQLLSTQELLDMLDKLNIDTGTFGQILSAINKLPAITDSIRVAFGTPNRAGMYMVTAVTDNKNYNTGVGTGILVVKMRLTGSKLTWNQTMPGNKLTAAQAAEFDFGATLSYNGDVSIDQSGVHYLYSGVTSKWRPYSSTTTPPTEPGRYVVTVCIIGGNHFASPITRSFQITK